MIKEYEYPTTCNEKIADWYTATHPEVEHDIDPEMTFIDLYISIKENDTDIFLACGEDMDIVDEVIWELADRMDVDYSDLRDGLFG